MTDSNDDRTTKGRDETNTLMVSDDNGFVGFVDNFEGGAEQTESRIIEGTRIKFTIDFRWTDNEGVDLDPGAEYVVTKVVRCVQKWGEQHPIETKVLRPGEPFPNVEATNAACPKTEWREDFNGNPKGPWEAEFVLYLTNAALDKFTFVAPRTTVGSARAVSELVDKVAWMQRYKGAGALAVVQLASVHMPTRYGGRQRPHFRIVRWVSPGGGDDVEPLALPKSPSSGVTAEVIPPATASSPRAMPSTKASTKTVEKPSLDDDIPW